MFFLTTAIVYPNSRPHIGTAFEKIGADVQARFQRMNGKNVFFLMGNDEMRLRSYSFRGEFIRLEDLPWQTFTPPQKEFFATVK